MCRAVGECADNVLECAVEGLRVIEGNVEKAICEFSAVRTNLVDTDCETAEATIEHEQNVGTVATRARIICVSTLAISIAFYCTTTVLTWIEKLLRCANTISDRLIAELDASHARREVK